MSKTWKWILGSILGVVILVTIGFAFGSFFISRTARAEQFENFRHPMADNYGHGNWRGPSFDSDKFHNRRGGFDHRMPMYGNRGFGGHGLPGYGFMPLPTLFFGWFVRLIFPLAVLVAVVYFAYRKGKKDGLATAYAASVSEAESVPEPVEPPKRKGKKVAGAED